MPNFPHYRIYDLRGSVCDSLGIDTPVQNDTTWAIRKDQVWVWPNPAGESATVSIPPGAVGPLRVFNVLGQLMYEVPSVRGSLTLTLDVANYPAGVYFVTVFYDSERFIFRCAAPRPSLIVNILQIFQCAAPILA